MATSDVRWETSGSFRLVLLVGDFAVKIARNEDRARFNRREAERSRSSSRYCPVLACYDEGRVLVMERAEPIGHEEFWRLQGSPEMEELTDYDSARPTYAEANGRNIGRRHGRLVYIDYGDES